MERIDAEAEALIRDLGDRAYHEARRREHEASSDTIAEDWALVARAVARQTGSRIGLNISTQLEMNTLFVLDRDPDEGRVPPVDTGPELGEPKRTTEAGQPFRIQFIGHGTDTERSILREVQIRASDASTAIIAAAMTAWPPKTIALRILDRQGHEVFSREKPVRRPGGEAGGQ
jgi:hypothetical protein